MQPDNKDPESKIVCFFAHKGGVSKTTNVYHLGWMLASQFNQRVILVDADPQCNLTHTLCKKARVNPYWRDAVPSGDIFEAVKPIHYGLKGKDLKPANCIEIKRATEGISDGKLYLLPGSLDLAKLEPQLSFAHNMNTAENFPLFFDVAGAFRDLFVKTSKYYYADIMLVDMGPSIGELNKNLFFSCDYFVIPCSPDSYCKSTIATMTRILPRWASAHSRLAQVTEDQDLAVKSTPTKFAGIVMSLFNVAGKHKKPVKQSQIWMDLVKFEVENSLIPTMEEMEMCCVDGIGLLASIPHFLQLMPLSQRVHYPVFCMPEDLMIVLDDKSEDGGFKPMPTSEKKRMTERGKYFEQIYYHFAERFIDVINN